jgi:probable HAF family extracellular repeat protein
MTAKISVRQMPLRTKKEDKMSIGIAGRLMTPLSIALALALPACTSEETPNGPSAGLGPELATIPDYTAIDLGAGPDSHAMAINAVGQVVGSFVHGGNTRAFLWSKGVLSDLGTLGGETSQALGIDSAGNVVGSAQFAPGSTDHAFLWSKGVMRDLGTLGPSSGSSQANAINAAGRIVGVSSTATPGRIHAFLWQNGVMKDLGTLGGGYSDARAISPLGDIVGESKNAAGRIHAVLWSQGKVIDLGTLGGNKSQAYGINRSERVVGASTRIGGILHAFLIKFGVMSDMGTLPGATTSTAFGLNPAGEVVGTSGGRPFLWVQGTMKDLGGLGQAFAINRLHQIVGESGPPGVEAQATLWIPK